MMNQVKPWPKLPVIGLAIIIVLLSFFSPFYRASQSPSNRSYQFIHNSIHDYNTYLSFLELGRNGYWLADNPYSTEPVTPSLFHLLYIWTGHLALPGLSTPILYHSLRFIGSILLLFAVWKLCRVLWPVSNWKYAAFVLYLLASPLFTLQTSYPGIPFTPSMLYWTPMDILTRHTFLPHHLFGNALMIFMLIVTEKFWQNRKLKWLASIPGIGCIAALIHPPSVIIYTLSLGFALGMYIIIRQTNIMTNKSLVKQERSKKKWKKNEVYAVVSLIGAGSICTILVALSGLQENLGFPWNAYRYWELSLSYPSWHELAAGLGITFIIAMCAIFPVWKKNSLMYFFLYFWCGLQFYLTTIGPKFGFWSFRFLQTAPHVPIAICATIAIIWFVQYSKKFIQEKYLTASILSIILLIQLPSMIFSINAAWIAPVQIFTNTHPEKTLFNAFDYLNIYAQKNDIVITSFIIGNTLPAYTKTRPVIGNLVLTYDLFHKRPDIEQFLYTPLPQEKAIEIMNKYHAKFIVTGEQEFRLWQNNPYPTLLKNVFADGHTRIYKVNQEAIRS